MIGVITQPNYFPWLGYFEQINYSELFVFLDNVQFPRREWCNRNRILVNGKVEWLTVPIQKCSRDTLIKDVKISYDINWQMEHLYKITRGYSNLSNFDFIYPLIEKVIIKKNKYLVDLNIDSIILLCNLFNIDINYKKASENEYFTKRTEKLVDICKQHGISHYYSSITAQNYMEDDRYLFDKNNIRVEYQKYNPTLYKQNCNTEFISHLSALDLIFNINPSRYKEIIISGATHE